MTTPSLSAAPGTTLPGVITSVTTRKSTLVMWIITCSMALLPRRLAHRIIKLVKKHSHNSDLEDKR